MFIGVVHCQRLDVLITRRLGDGQSIRSPHELIVDMLNRSLERLIFNHQQFNILITLL